MLDLRNVENKKELFQSFFTWIFNDERIVNKEITLISETDLSLCPDYLDNNIYYPKQFEKFFETPAMKRLARVSQLGLAINPYPNLYHNRLEHSKGTYYRKLEELFYNYQNPKWKMYIEDNNMKLYLIAELLKMAGHDIGHPPLSHAIEEQIFKYRGAHEDIGKRIMLEDPYIKSVYNSISPDLLSIMEELYTQNVLNFRQHDESNYDVDRLDYIFRDNFYLGNYHNLFTQKYTNVPVLTDESYNPKENADLSICESVNGNKIIDVYELESLPEIEKTLLLRQKSYNDVYLSPQTHIYESCIGNFFNAFLETESKVGINLKNILLKMKGENPNHVNLNEYIDFDEITLYSELLDIANSHENKNVRDLATMIIPNIESFLNLIYSHLNMYNKNANYTDYEKKFLKKIKNIISSSNELSINLKNKNFTFSNTLILPDDYQSTDIPITCQRSKIKAYKQADPIYIRDKNGKIFELSNHPNRSCDWKNKYNMISLNFAFIPYLRFKGISENQIKDLQSKYPDASRIINKFDTTHNQKFNLAPLKIHNKIEDKFLEI